MLMLKHTLSLALFLFVTTILIASEDVVEFVEMPATKTLADAFKKGKVSGQIRAGYIHSTPKDNAEPTTYTTALGGQLKYETASFYGFSIGAALYTSHAITAWSGDKSLGEFNEDMTGAKGYYDILAESYINYQYEGFNLRVGRQLIDTPYADSDDIRMTPNTFQGAIATYALNNFTFLGGYLTKWQGPDATYEFEKMVADSDGIAVVSAAYADDALEAGAWYYNVDKAVDIYYTDVAYTYVLNDNMPLKVALQVGHQEEIDNSGIAGTLYGAMAELAVSGFTLGVAFNQTKMDDGHEYITGFGGGVGFVNMYEMTATVLSILHSTTAWKVSVAYDFSSLGAEGLSIEYDFADFDAGKNFEAREQNFIFTYAPSEEWDFEAIYASIDDKHHDLSENQTDISFDTILIRANYNF